MLESDRLINSLNKETFDKALRPKKFEEYIGQPEALELINVGVKAAKMRSECLDHIIIFGPPGLGKTTLANIIANEMKVNLITTSGPAMEKGADIAANLSTLQKNDILFIDEIHRLHPKVEEILYSAMEDYCIDIMLGEGAGATSMRYQLQPFTLIGATTKAGSLTSPLLSRFGYDLRLKYYNENDLSKIIIKSSQKLETTIHEDASLEIAKRSHGTPRIANNLLKRVRDYAQIINEGIIDLNITKHAFKKLNIDKHGLDYWDRKLLLTLIHDFNNTPTGLNTLAATIGEDAKTIEELIEPYLLNQGFIKKMPNGRIATDKAIKYFIEQQFNHDNI